MTHLDQTTPERSMLNEQCDQTHWLRQPICPDISGKKRNVSTAVYIELNSESRVKPGK